MKIIRGYVKLPFIFFFNASDFFIEIAREESASSKVPVVSQASTIEISCFEKTCGFFFIAFERESQLEIKTNISFIFCLKNTLSNFSVTHSNASHIQTQEFNITDKYS